jgi:TRAP-type C4-dicarboxylate transport system permease small subunit
MLIAANSNQTPEVAIHFTRAIQSSIRMFVVGAGLPLVAWEIAASEFDRSNTKIKLLESWTTYFVLIVSWVLFFFAAWRLPNLIIEGLRA